MPDVSLDDQFATLWASWVFRDNYHHLHTFIWKIRIAEQKLEMKNRRILVYLNMTVVFTIMFIQTNVYAADAVDNAFYMGVGDRQIKVRILENDMKHKEEKMAVKQTAGRDALGEFAPKFAQLNDDVLFGEVWSREDKLSLRDRSLVTVVSLMAQGLVDSSFQFHLLSAKKNGIPRTEAPYRKCPAERSRSWLWPVSCIGTHLYSYWTSPALPWIPGPRKSCSVISTGSPERKQPFSSPTGSQAAAFAIK